MLKATLALILLLSLILPCTAVALHPDLVIPEKVEVKHKACQELLRIGRKYQVEGLFPKDFEAGKEGCALTRLEMAVALQLLTERLAEKAMTEGPVVAREDLALLSELKEELRGEMLLAQTRAFQLRYTELGTNLHALTKKITISGGMTGVLQGSAGNRPKDYSDVVGRGDIVFSFKVGETTTAVIDIEATGGNGIDAHIASFSGLNGVAGATDDRVRFREAWVEHSAFNDRFIMTAGKISLTNYFDSNSIANNENSQFLASAFVNSAVLSTPDNGPGIRAHVRLAEPLTFGLGYASGDADSADILEHGVGIAELAWKYKTGELEGNIRGYGVIDSALPIANGVKTAQGNSLGAGVSIDQQLSDQLTLFARYGWHDQDFYRTKSAWSLGLQFTGPCQSRKDDLLAFAYGQVQGVGSGQEKLLEFYYRLRLNEQINLSPHIQYLFKPEGDATRDDLLVLGLRTQIIF